MTDPPNWSFETRQIHVGQVPDSADRRPGAADLPDHVVRVQGHRPRGEPVRAQGVREHLHPDHEPDAGRRRAADRVARGWRRGAARRVRAGRGDAGLPQRRRGGGPHRGQPVPLRRHVQPAEVHAAEVRRSRRRSSRTRTTSLDSWRAAVQPNTKAVLRRDDRQPEVGDPRHRGRGGDRPRGRCAADRRQHHRDAVPDPPARSTAPTSCSTRRPSTSAATGRPSPASSSTAGRSTSARTRRSSPTSTRRRRATTGWSSPVTSA